MSGDQHAHREQQEAAGHVWGAGEDPEWEQHAALPEAGVKHTQPCRQPEDKTGLPPCHPSTELLPQVMLIISQRHWQQRVAPKL